MSGESHWIDAHSHLADPRLEPTLDEILARSRAAGITGWIQGGTWPDDWNRQRELRAKHGPRLVTAYGLHPWWVAQKTEAELESAFEHLQRLAHEPQAIGEVGLDFGQKHGEREELQKHYFEAQLRLAQSVAKPIVFHIVHAHGEALPLLEALAPFPAGGIVHLFSGSREIAERYIRLGFLISVGGSVTHRGYQTLKRALKTLPADSLVVETDSPDQTPEGCRDHLNEPANLIQIARTVAEIRGETPEALLRQSTQNLEKLFSL